MLTRRTLEAFFFAATETCTTTLVLRLFHVKVSSPAHLPLSRASSPAFSRPLTPSHTFARLCHVKAEFATANGAVQATRSMCGIVSAPLGGALYSAMGMTGPYAVIGTFTFFVAAALRILIGSISAANVARPNASAWILFRIPAFGAMLFAIIVQFACFQAMEVTGFLDLA